jgi:prepilin-type processing-associated H-X9-DG protein
MTRTTVVFLLLLAICSGAWAGGAAQPTDFAALLSGSPVPLTLTLKDLDNSWRAFSASGAQEPGSVYGAIYGMPSTVYYSKGQTVTASGETYLVAYSLQAKKPSYVTMMMGRGGVGQPEALTAASLVGLSLLNVRTMGNLTDIRPFDRDGEIAAYAKSYQDLAAAAASSNEEAPSSTSSLKNVAIAVEMFMADYDKLPPMKTPEDFRKALEEYVKNDAVFKDPETGEYYAVNSSISDKSVSDIKDPAKMVVAYQATPGKDGKRGVAFADGHVQQVTEDQWKDLKAGSNIP